MPLTKEALEHIEDQALTAAAKPIAVKEGQVVVLPERVVLRSLEPFQFTRSRFRGAFTTSALGDFARYVERHTPKLPLPPLEEPAYAAGARPVPGFCIASPSAAAFIDQDEMSAQVIFDLGDMALAGHGEHTARLKLKPTAAYQALCHAASATLKQAALAEWLEDWRPHLQAFAHENAEPMTMAAAIAAVRHMTVKAVSQRDSVVEDLSASRSAMDKIEAESQGTLPRTFTFTCVPYEGLSSISVQLRAVFIPQGDDLTMRLRWIGQEAQTEAITQDFRDVLTGALGDALPITIGTFALGK